MAITPAELKSDVELLLTDAEDVLPLLEELPAPVAVKEFFARAEAVLKDVQAFLSA